MSIKPDIKLPTDTMAMIASESLLGGKYMSLEPGVDEDMIKNDGTGRITRTQAPMRLDDLIGQLIYGSKRDDASKTAPGSLRHRDRQPQAGCNSSRSRSRLIPDAFSSSRVSGRWCFCLPFASCMPWCRRLKNRSPFCARWIK